MLQNQGQIFEGKIQISGKKVQKNLAFTSLSFHHRVSSISSIWLKPFRTSSSRVILPSFRTIVELLELDYITNFIRFLFLSRVFDTPYFFRCFDFCLRLEKSAAAGQLTACVTALNARGIFCDHKQKQHIFFVKLPCDLFCSSILILTSLYKF